MRVAVPYCRRREVIDVGHRGLAGGHFSHNNMVASITQHFTWTELRKDVKAYCSACLECQKAGRQAAQTKSSSNGNFHPSLFHINA